MPNGNFWVGAGGFNSKRSGGAGARRNFALGIITGIPANVDNKYVPGAGVGASSIANRRARLIRSTSCTGRYPCNRSFARIGLQHNGNSNFYALNWFVNDGLPIMAPATATAPAPAPAPVVTVPGPPTNLNVTYVSGTTYTVTFNPPTNNGGSQITGYTLNYTDLNGTNYNINNISSGDNVQLTFPSTYTFTLTATNSVGTSIPSTPPFIVAYPPSTPDPPTNIILTNISADLVGVNFTAPINTGSSAILSYTINCTPVGRPDIIITPITTNSLSNQITLPQGVAYTITVIATNAIGNSSPSSTSTPPSITPISNPSPTITQFTNVGSTTWVAPATATSVNYLVVGGGAGGGGAYDFSAGGGGGAGLVLTGTKDVTPGQTYTVTVGAGGAGAVRPTYISGQGPSVNSADGSPGDSSNFDTIVAGGGGFGYKSRTAASGTSIPSGGLQASGTTPPTGGSGGNGGPGVAGSGGGGNSSDGTNGAVGVSGQGGSGISSTITGTSLVYGQGGSGGVRGSNSPGASGQTNRGNGGSGGGSLSSNNIGGASGGSGIVIISFNT